MRSSRSPTVDRQMDRGTTGVARRRLGCAGAGTSVASFGARHDAQDARRPGKRVRSILWHEARGTGQVRPPGPDRTNVLRVSLA
jgi:hypothetical protein